MKKILFSILAVALLSSCATQTFSVNKNIKREIPANNPHFSKWSNFFLSGIGQSDFQNAADLCKQNGGVAFVEAKQSFGQVILSGVTFGIYTPRNMNIYCNR